MKVSTKLLTHEEEIELSRLAKFANDEDTKQKAVDKLILHNLRLVMVWARKYSYNDQILFEDLVQEGVKGLITAIPKYDEDSGYRFGTYASWWVRQAIQLYLYNNGRTIRVPRYVVEQSSRANRIRSDLGKTLGREPTEEEVAELLELDVDKVRTADVATLNTSSLEFPIGDDSTLADVVEDEESNTPDDAYERKETSELIGKILANLSSREERVIRQRFGIGTSKEHTLEEIGNSLNLTKERIRQIEKQALTKLAKGDNLKQLKELMD